MEILQPSGWPRPKGYSNGIAASGKLVVTGGLVGWDHNEEFVAKDLVGQAAQTFKNILAVLAEADAMPEHIVRLTWYITDKIEYQNSIKEIGAAYRDVFGKRFPDRMFDVGIAEQHAVTFAAGLSTEGYKPFVAIYSTFLQRAYDQVVHDVAIQKLPVRFAIDRAGLVGADGPTHAGSFDVTYLSTLPNFVVMGASDEAELVKMINTAVSINDRPSAFRYPRGNGIGVELPDIKDVLEIGKGKIIKEGKKVAILNFGARLQESLKAAKNLDTKGISTTIADARFAKPLDEKLVMDLSLNHEVLITIEEGSIGGFGSHVMQMLSERGVFDKGLKMRSMTFPDKFLDQDTPEEMYKKAGLDCNSIIEKIENVLKSNVIVAKNTIKKFP